MRIMTAVQAALLAAALAVAAPAATSFDKVAPEGTIAFVSLKNLPALQQKVQTHWIHDLWMEASVQRFVEKAIARGSQELQKAEAQSGVSASEMWKVFNGQVALMLTLDAKTAAPEFVVLADVGARGERAMQIAAALWTAYKAKDAGPTKTVDVDIQGCKFVTIQKAAEGAAPEPVVTYGTVGDVLVAGGTAAVTRTVGFLKAPPAASLATSQRYQAVVNRVSPTAELLVYVDLAQIVTVALQRANQPQAAPLVAGLGLNGLGGAGLGVEMAPDYETTRIYVQTVGAPQGILKILMPPPGPLHTGAGVPEDVTGFASARFDAASIWDEVVKVIGVVQPMVLANLNAQLAQAAQAAGVTFDLRNDLLAVFGPRLQVYTRMDKPYKPGAPPQVVIATDISNKAAFQGALEKLRKMNPMISAALEQREYMGQTMYVVKAPQPRGGQGIVVVDKPRPAFAVTEKEFILAFQSDAVEAHLRRAAAGGKSLQDRQEFQDTLRALPAEGRIMITFNDPRPQVEMLLSRAKDGDVANVVATLKQDPKAAEIADLFDLTLLPPAADLTKHIPCTAGCATVQPEGLMFITRSPAKAPPR